MPYLLAYVAHQNPIISYKPATKRFVTLGNGTNSITKKTIYTTNPEFRLLHTENILL